MEKEMEAHSFFFVGYLLCLSFPLFYLPAHAITPGRLKSDRGACAGDVLDILATSLLHHDNYSSCGTVVDSGFKGTRMYIKLDYFLGLD